MKERIEEFFKNHDNAVAFLIFGVMFGWGGALLSAVSGWGLILMFVGVLCLVVSGFGL